jgi:hypothetical protein
MWSTEALNEEPSIPSRHQDDTKPLFWAGFPGKFLEFDALAWLGSMPLDVL